MCSKRKKETKKTTTKKKHKHKEPGYLLHPEWAFYPQLCIYWFVVLRGNNVQRWASLCVRESVSKLSTAAAGRSDSLTQATPQDPSPREPSEKHAGARFTQRTLAGQEKSRSVNCGLQGGPAQCGLGPETTLAHAPQLRRPSTGLRFFTRQSLLAICCSLCSSSGSPPLDVSPIVSVQQWLIERDANERSFQGVFFLQLGLVLLSWLYSVTLWLCLMLTYFLCF